MKRIFLLALVLSLFISASVAEELAWGVDIDMQKLRSSPLYKLFEGDLDGDGKSTGLSDAMDEVKGELGFNPAEDLDSLTAYSTSFDKEQGVMLLKGKFKTKEILKAIGREDDYAATKQGKYTIHEWKQDNMKPAGTIVNDNLIVAASEKAILSKTLDELDKNNESPLSKQIVKDKKTAPNGAYLFMTVRNVANAMTDEMKQENPMGQQVKDVMISAGENGGNFFINSELTAVSEEAATQIQQMITGMLAMFKMQAQQEPDSPIASLLNPLKVSNSASKINISYEYPAAELAELIKKAQTATTFDFDDDESGWDDD